MVHHMWSLHGHAHLDTVLVRGGHAATLYVYCVAWVFWCEFTLPVAILSAVIFRAKK